MSLESNDQELPNISPNDFTKRLSSSYNQETKPDLWFKKLKLPQVYYIVQISTTSLNTPKPMCFHVVTLPVIINHTFLLSTH